MTTRIINEKTSETFEYTQENRLLTHTHKINSGPTKYLSEFTYDAIGQPIANYIEGSSSPLQKIDYKYNIRGWLTDINNVSNLATSGAPQDLFSFRINYDRVSTSNPQVRPMYNGNIAETSWRTSSDNIRRKYEYAYDDLDRLLGAYFNIPGTAVQGSYDEYLSYDSNGNILTLQRYGEREDAALPMLIDDLKYGYDTGNKLLNVTDEEAHPSGFNDGNKHTQTNLPDFEYDVAGNLTRDRNKGITNITHNHLHQPKEISVSKDTLSGSIAYIYDAEGNKVQKQVAEGRTIATTDYLGGFQYLDGKLDFLPHAEGYVKAVNTGSTTEYHYVYHYTDHLGNIRLSYGRDPETNEIAILKESHYYPFGLQHNGYVGTHRTTGVIGGVGGNNRVGLIPVRNYLDDSYRYTFGGKEEQPELGLNWIDHHARNYMPDLGRWMNPDPLGEEYSSWSPYNFVMNSPLRFIDPTGMFIELPTKPGEIEGEVHFDKDTGASYTWDGEGGWHSDMQGVEELDQVVITNEDSSGNDSEYSQVVTNTEYIGGGGAIEYIGGGGIIKGVSLLRNAKVAGWVKGLIGGGKVAKTKVSANRLNHIFGKSEHALESFVKKFGSQEKTYNAVQNAANQALKAGKLTPNAKGILPSGDMGNIINVSGINVRLIGGRVENGKVILSSFSRKGL